jgi:hypothetical protein
MDSIAKPVAVRLDMPGSQLYPPTEVDLMIHRLLPAAAFYFFFNCAGLPLGLFYTSIFSPLLFLWLYFQGRRWLTTKFLLLLSPFILAHMVDGVTSVPHYLRSLLLMWTVYIAVYAFCWALINCKNVERLFEQLIQLNFCVAILALAIRPTPLWPLLWQDNANAYEGAPPGLRMNLPSTTEPWAYGQLMLPLLIFAACRLLRDSRLRNVAFMIMIVVPLLLCQSFGGISLGLAGILVLIMTNLRRLLRRPQSWIVIMLLAFVTTALILIPNPISDRISRVISGGDDSTNLRVVIGYLGAYTSAASKSLWWGVGLGQAKFVDYSDLGGGIIDRLPNAVADTLGQFGVIGLVVRFVVEFCLFFKTKVYKSSFRLAMFIVAFISQLTGSYVDDVQSYLLWLCAFYPLFPNSELSEKPKRECPAV